MMKNMKTILRKYNLIAILALAGLFLTSCDGSTTIYGIEHRTKQQKHKKYPRYDTRNDHHKGKHKNGHSHGNKSSKRYAPGQHNKKVNKYYKKGKNNHKHHHDD
ncbi:hypothetical protein [Algoriella sp.]|uniref:hypothetical protein n=1 Tax=Algoriella sp. TaxID=1872434 RepID=UPI002FC87AD5